MHSLMAFGRKTTGHLRLRAATRLAASLALGTLVLLAQPGAGVLAQDRAATLADIRQQLTVLNVEIQGLKRELSTTGAPSQLATGGSQIDRLNALEAELRRLTARTEEMDHRIDRIVADGTNRIGDLEFRLVELEGGDLSQLGETSTLGGGEAAPETVITAPTTPAPADDAPQLAISEEADFQAAAEKLAAGDFGGALTGYETFKATYPGSPLSPAADLGRGRALEGQGEIKTAARAYLDAFSAAPKGDIAPEALHRLGLLLGQLGQQAESCVTLGEVGNRFPGSTWASEAAQARLNQGCS